jgi:hypothetical protein
MTDYQPLISRAVTSLDNNTSENRHVLYERARAALVNQLRSVEPPLEESDITRERLALEDAIRKVEAEAEAEAEAAKGKGPDASGAVRPQPSISEQGLRGFRDSVANAERLSGAAVAPSRSTREVHEAMPADREPPAGGNERPPAERFFEPPTAAATPEPAPQQRHDAALAEAPVPAPPADALPPTPSPHFDEDDQGYSRPVRSYGRMIRFILLLLVLAGLGGGAYWQRDAIMSVVASYRSVPPPKPRQVAEPASRPKIADRIGPAEGTSAPANAPAAAVAQKVVLYDEDPSDPKGKRYVGSALWRTETVSPGPGLAPELAIRADVEIPERHMRMTWSLRRNTDKALPASHTIEIMFTLPADFDQGGIANVPGVLMKPDEQTRGVPLAGLAVKVTNGYFLIGLSAIDVDMQRNIQLLKERDWFDIPIVYTSGKRAILAMEKGTPGVRAFQEAFRAWGE